MFFFLHSGEPKLSSALFLTVLSKPPLKHHSYPLKARGERVPSRLHMSSHRQGVSHKGTKTWNFWNQRDGQKKKKNFFSKTTKNPTKQTVFCHMWELQSSSIYKINGTTLWHMLQLIPRTAASKKKKKKVSNLMSQQDHHKIEDHHWFAWLCSPSPKVRI